jgi:hypothetical protein
MARRIWEEEDWDEEGDGVGGPPDDDWTEAIPCPYCRRQIPENTPRCPYCENYLSEEDTPPSRKPWWIVLGTLLALYAVYRWVAG